MATTARLRRRDFARAGDDRFEAWLERATERLDPFMAWLGVVFALLVAFELAADLDASAANALALAGWAIWGVFALEFLTKLWLAPRKLLFVRRHWPQTVGLLLPALRVLRLLRLFRVGRALPAARVLASSYRGVGSARRLLGSRLGYLAGVGSVVALAVSELVYLFEHDRGNPGLDSFGDALVWGVSVVLALQADPVPESAGGRVVMLVGFAFGLVVIASLAGTIGAFLVEGRERR